MSWEPQDCNWSVTDQNTADEEMSDSRQRLRPWLVSRLNSGTIPGLEWVDKSAQIFKVPWKHGGKQDWVPEQSQIFKEWACHTGKFREGVDTPTYAKWKTNLRCALNKAPDIQEIKDLTKKSDPNPYKVYQFLKRKKKVQAPAVTAPEPEPIPAIVGSEEPPVPAFLGEYSSPDVMLEQYQIYRRPRFMQPQNQFTDVEEGKEAEQLYQPSNIDNWNIKLPGESAMKAYRETDEVMDFDSILQQSTSHAGCMPVSCSPETGTVGPYSSASATLMGDSTFQPIPSMPSMYAANATVVQANMEHTIQQDNPTRANEGHPYLPFNNLGTSHNCVSVTGGEMYLEIIYMNNIINTQHIKTRARGCRITYTTGLWKMEEEIPDFIKDVLFGSDSKDREVVELPQWPNGLCPDHLLPSVSELLRGMHRGIILECYSGNIYATRLCKTSLYYSSGFTPNTLKLLRHDDSIEKTKIFDMDNDFKPALEAYESQKGAKRPSPYVYLYIGQNGTEAQLSSLMIVVRLTSCQALTLLKPIDNRRTLDHSMHISSSTELDRLGESVRKQLNGQLHL